MVRILFFISCITTAMLLLTSAARAELVELKTGTALRSVWLIEDNQAPTIRVQSVFIAGEADFDGPEGLSHYLEHILYWHASKLNDKPYHGRTGNAWVNGYITTYYNEAKRAEIDELFAYAGKLLTPPDLDRKFMLDERNVVVREYDLRVVESPDRRANEASWRMLAGPNPAGRSVIGTPQSIISLTLDHARSFHEKYYHPANMILLISGPVGKDEAIRRVEETFGDIPAGPVNKQIWRNGEIADPFDETVKMQDRYATVEAVKHTIVADWTSGDRITDIYAVLMAEALLQSALPGSLAKPLRTDAFVLANFSVGMSTILNKRIEFLIQARPDEGVSQSKAINSIREVLARIGEKGVPDKSVERIRRRLLKAANRLADDTDFTIRRATTMISYGATPNTHVDHVARLESIDRKTINSLFKALGDPQRQVSTMISPEASQ